MQVDSPEEILDLVDENDVVIGSLSRKEVYTQGLKNFRVVNIFVRNNNGELWIPRRTATKKLFPLYLDMSAAGHVESGESYEEAFAKEVREEIGIDVTAVSCKELGHLSPYSDKVSAFSKIYEITYDDVPTYNPDDFVEYYWLTPARIIELWREGEKMKSDIPILITKYYLS
jgi:isopentenyl-diphosphate delta-isomerase